MVQTIDYSLTIHFRVASSRLFLHSINVHDRITFSCPALSKSRVTQEHYMNMSMKLTISFTLSSGVFQSSRLLLLKFYKILFSVSGHMIVVHSLPKHSDLFSIMVTDLFYFLLYLRHLLVAHSPLNYIHLLVFLNDLKFIEFFSSFSRA